MKISFHVRFIQNGFVSHFMPIDVKRETNGYFGGSLPMKHQSKGMKRSTFFLRTFISPQNDFVSLHFTFRFTPFSATSSQDAWVRCCGAHSRIACA